MRIYRCVLTFAAIGLFSALTWHSTALENEATNRSNIHRQYAHDRIEWVCPTSISPPDCIAEANHAARENEREEQDLAAQKITAWWTKVMGIAAMVGMGLSAVGVWLVKTTFEETRKSNDIAHDHQRARLLPSAQLTRTHYLSETKKVVLRCENIGLSPAYRVRCLASTMKDIPNRPPIKGIGGYEWTVKVHEKQDLVLFENFNNDHFLVGVIQYNTIFGGPKFSYFCFRFTRSSESGEWFAESRIPETWPTAT